MREKPETTFTRLSSIEAEEAVLGAILLEDSILGWLNLTDEHFSSPKYLHIFRGMRLLYEEDKPIDDVTLWNKIKGSDGTGVELTDLSKLAMATPTADNAEHWADILEEKRKLRVIARSVSETIKSLNGDGKGTSDEIQDEILSDLASLTASGKGIDITMSEAVDGEMARLENQWSGGEQLARMQMGIVKVDKYTGGMPIGVMTALGARPGIGKSTILWNIGYNVAKRGEHVLVLSNEDKPAVSARLAIANATGIERIRILKGDSLTEEEKYDIRTAIENMREANSRYHTVRIHGKKMKEVCREGTAMIRRYGIKFAALDYIQNVPQPEAGLSRNYGIEANLTDLEAMVADEDIPFALVGQIKRIEENRRPLMDDFKDSGSIEQKCKLMMILSNGENDTMDVDVVKNSEGQSGGTVILDINKGLGRLW